MLVIIDYGLGNLASVQNMFRKLGVKDVLISGKSEEVMKADKLLLPGVGAFDAGMEHLTKSGLVETLNQKVLQEKVPILGICLGMQLLTKSSEEGALPGLGWINARTVKFQPDPSLGLKVPHMGWEYVKVTKQNALLPEKAHSRFYFVHSYHVVCEDPEQSIGLADFGGPFTCMVNKDNIFGTQFHPEKSLKFGMEVLKNFSSL